MNSTRVTLVMAAKNEALSIGSLIDRAKAWVDEVIVVDGHSSDRTAETATAHGAKVVLDRKKGKGDAIRCAIPHLQHEITVFMDADGSHNPDDIPRLLEPLKKGDGDHVSASRLLGGSSELHGGFDEFFRLSGSALITTLVNARFGTRLSDSQNGFRAIRTEVLRKLELEENITTIEQEMIIKTLKKGYRMVEVGCHEYPRQHGQSSIRISKVWMRYLWSLVRYLYFS